MLYAIITDKWISGIFAAEAAARSYLQEIPAATRLKHVLSELIGLYYPLYIVEDSAGFRFMTGEAAFEIVQSQPLSANDDDCCLTLYRIDRDYRPAAAGEDEMGALPHTHIDNELLARVQREGRAGLRLLAASP